MNLNDITNINKLLEDAQAEIEKKIKTLDKKSQKKCRNIQEDAKGKTDIELMDLLNKYKKDAN